MRRKHPVLDVKESGMDHKEKSELESCHNTISQLEQRCFLLESFTQDLEKRLEAQAREKLQIERESVETERDLQEELRKAELDKEDLRGELEDKDFEIRDLEEKLRRVHCNVQEFHKRKYDINRGGSSNEGKGGSASSLSGLIGKGEPPTFVDVKGHGRFPLGAAIARAGGKKPASGRQGASGKATARENVVQHELADFFNMRR